MKERSNVDGKVNKKNEGKHLLHRLYEEAVRTISINVIQTSIKIIVSVPNNIRVTHVLNVHGHSEISTELETSTSSAREDKIIICDNARESYRYINLFAINAFS